MMIEGTIIVELETGEVIGCDVSTKYYLIMR